MTNYAPIALFVYNRLSHTRKTVAALQNNPEAQYSDLVIFSDGPKTDKDQLAVTEVRAYLKQITGFKSIHICEQNKNIGLANSIIQGVSQVLKDHEHIIVLEDDLETSPGFLAYMNQALAMYRDHPKVASIHGYVYPVKATLPDTFFMRGTSCWGWATWRSVWQRVEWDGKKLLDALQTRNLSALFDYDHTYPYTKMLQDQIAGNNNSWAIRWHAWAFLEGLLTLYPGTSLVQNIGHDGSGVHCGRSRVFRVSMADICSVQKIAVEQDELARTAFKQFFVSLKPSVLRRILSKLKRIIIG